MPKPRMPDGSRGFEPGGWCEHRLPLRPQPTPPAPAPAVPAASAASAPVTVPVPQAAGRVAGRQATAASPPPRPPAFPQRVPAFQAAAAMAEPPTPPGQCRERLGNKYCKACPCRGLASLVLSPASLQAPPACKPIQPFVGTLNPKF